jgi:hypothetical protein
MGRNKHRLVRVQRLTNNKIAKAYRTVSTEALCVLTGLIPITIKIEASNTTSSEAVKTQKSKPG